MRIESAGTNYAELNHGNYLRIYINDAEVGSFTRGISFVILNKDTIAVES